MYSFKKIPSPVGELTLIASEKKLVSVLWNATSINARKSPYHPILLETEKQLREYFTGKRKAFALPLAVDGTVFQKRVWTALQKIPYGETRSYGELAKSIGSPKACRAVGGANGKNPLSIVVPCHRVIGSDGSLTGFGGGIRRKQILLAIESGKT